MQTAVDVRTHWGTVCMLEAAKIMSERQILQYNWKIGRRWGLLSAWRVITNKQLQNVMNRNDNRSLFMKTMHGTI